mmetsp:Transcript_5425/g.9489  ORF Transcript_5425/g.9489 Transcript_5425/m.9489 type:complete len:641 (+) Transcript_5425:41-1963(+)
MANLTSGSIQQIVNGEVTGLTPTLQVINVKKVQGAGADRFRLIISDGQYYAQCMLATQLNHLVSSNELQELCIVKLTNYVVNNVQGRRIVIGLAVEVVSGPVPKVGDPQNSSGGPAPAMPAQASNPPPAAQPQQRSNPYQQGSSNPYQQGSSNPYQQSSNPYGGGSSNSNPYGGNTNTNTNSNPYANTTSTGPVARENPNAQYQPIASLNPYQNRWTIKARVTKRSDIRRWSNARGEGHLASVDLLDAEGTEIRATMFKEDCDRLYERLQEGKVFSFSGGRLKVANKQYTSIKNDYEITFGSETVVEGPLDEAGIEQNKFSFVDIAALSPDAGMVDLIAVVKSAGELSTIISKKQGGKELQKRDLTLVDRSGAEVRLTVWGESALAQAQWENSPVVAFKGLRASDYGGVSLSSLNSTVVMINPDLPEGHALHAWWTQQGGATQQTRSLSAAGPGGSRWVTKVQNRAQLGVIKDIPGIGAGEKPDYAEVKAMLSYMRHDNGPWYTSCPNDDCKKKMTEGFDQKWSCEKCNKQYDRCKHRYVLSTRFIEASGQDWVSAFNDEAEMILNKTADELQQLQSEGNDVAYEAAFAAANFQHFVAQLRIKQETYNDQARLKLSLVRLKPVDPVEESRMLLEAIDCFQ